MFIAIIIKYFIGAYKKNRCIQYMQQINIRNLLMSRLLFDLSEQYEKNIFSVNKSLQSAFQKITNILSLKKEKSFEEAIKKQVTIFIYCLIKGPSVWMDLLKNDLISTRSTQITINSDETLTRVYREIIKQTNFLISEQVKQTLPNSNKKAHQIQKTQDFEKQYINEGIKNMIAEILDSQAHQICKFFEDEKAGLLSNQKQVQEQLKVSKIMNIYLMFGILKQLSITNCRQIESNMINYLPNLPFEAVVSFCRYIQKNYDLLTLVCQEKISRLLSDEEMEKNVLDENQFWLKFISNFRDDEIDLKRLKSSKGDTAIMMVNKRKQLQNINKVSNKQSLQEAQSLILKIGTDNKIYVTSSLSSQKRWEIFTIKDSISGLYRILKNQFSNKAAETAVIQSQNVIYGLPLGQYANLGGNLGKCLADINKYKSPNHFFKDLSKNTLIGGSITYILSKVPILSYFVIAGGLTYTFYHLLRNKATSKSNKLKQIGQVTVTAVGSVGSTVAGMMLGQTLIPIPFLGIFVGGIIGGFLGKAGTNIMTKLMKKENYKNLIAYLLESIIEERYWSYDKKALSEIGINEKYFEQALCSYKQKKKKDSYLTLICFCIVSFYESTKYTERNEAKIKQLKQLEEYGEKSADKKSKIEQLMLQNSHQVQEQTEFNIGKILDYLTEAEVFFVHQLKKVENCISHLFFS